MTDHVLTATNLHFAYQSKGESLTILSGTDLALARGETVAVVGASGTGKSTLLHILAGLDTPQQGEITLCGTNLSQASDTRRTRLRNQQDLSTNFTTCCPNSARWKTSPCRS